MKSDALLKKRMAQARVRAGLASYRPSWTTLLSDKLNRLSFPSLTQGADKLSEGKYLAGQLSIMRYYDPKVKVPPDIGARLEKAIVNRETGFLKEFREASVPQSPLRDIYSWMLRNTAIVEACGSAGEILRLAKQKFPKVRFGERHFYKTLAEVGLPLSRSAKNRNL